MLLQKIINPFNLPLRGGKSIQYHNQMEKGGSSLLLNIINKIVIALIEGIILFKKSIMMWAITIKSETREWVWWHTFSIKFFLQNLYRSIRLQSVILSLIFKIKLSVIVDIFMLIYWSIYWMLQWFIEWVYNKIQSYN